MIGRIFTADHHVYDLPKPLSWTVRHTGSVPCDSYTITVLYQREMAPVLKMAAGFAAIENGQTVLRGIVDSYTIELEEGGTFATLTGRGYAARLLDNESRPLTYQDATLAEIIQSHVTPYGIQCAEAASIRAGGVYTVAAGSSQWKALEGFCRTFGGFSPRFDRWGRLLAVPETPGSCLRISEGDPILSCTVEEDYYGVLTEALVIDKKRNVSYSVKNQDMIAKGGQCRHVIYTPGSSTWDAMRYTGEYQIQQSKQDQKAVVLTLPGSFLAFPGDRVALDLREMDLQQTFRVAEVENRFSAGEGAVLELTLKEE